MVEKTKEEEMTIWQKITFFASKVWKFIKPTVMSLLRASGAIVMEVVTKHVAEIELSYKDKDADKRAIAVDAIKEDLRQRGISLLASELNKYIEIAVGNLNK